MIEENPIIAVLLLLLVFLYGLIVSNYNLKRKQELEEQLQYQQEQERLQKEQEAYNKAIEQSNRLAYVMMMKS